MRPITRRSALALAAAAGFAAATARAQAYPSKPLRWVVGYPAGGGTDFLARTVSARVSQQIGQPVLVDNRPGAGAIIASENVARSPGDGYNLFSADNGVLVYNQALYKKLPYDPIKDFAPVGLMGRSPLIITAAPGAGIADAATLVAKLKAEPGKWNIATAGTGSPHHLALELFQREAGVTLSHIPYKGGAPALQDLMGNQIPLMMLDLPSGISAVKAGKVVPLLAMSAERVPQLPNIPTAKELGFGKVEAYTWQGVVVPAATPKDIQTRLGQELLAAMGDAGVRQKLYDAGWEAQPGDAAHLQAYAESERTKWHALIKARNITLE